MLRLKNYNSLWKKTASAKIESNEMKKVFALIDDFCFKADLCEKFEEHVSTLCEAMEHFLQRNDLRKYLELHPSLKQRILMLGENITENSYRESDLYYLGVLTEMKLKQNWLDQKIYSFVKTALSKILKNGAVISEALRKKTRETIKQSFPDIYQKYFYKGNIIQFSTN